MHRQSSPGAVEDGANLGGTSEAWEHTHSVDDRSHHLLRIDETGNRTRRLAEQLRAHPNTIRQLATGEAILIRDRPRFAVEQLRFWRPRRPSPAGFAEVEEARRGA